MAKLKLLFPMKGRNTNFATSQQPQFTSPFLNNVRPFDTLENRARGGQRPGLIKRFNQNLGGPIVGMCQVTTVKL